MPRQEISELPPVRKSPCSECPWRRNALGGFLGPNSPEEWIEVAHSEQPIACHKSIKVVQDDGLGDWNDPAIRQCAGAAIFRSNVFKLPHIAATLPADREKVFARNAEFIEHHMEGYESLRRIKKRREV